MMYPYLTLNDDTEITHSEVRPDGRVKVYIETPDEKKTVFMMPPAIFQIIPKAFTDILIEEMEYFKRLIRDNAHLILEFAQERRRIERLKFLIGSYIVYFWSNKGIPLEPVHVHIAEGRASKISALENNEKKKRIGFLFF